VALLRLAARFVARSDLHHPFPFPWHRFSEGTTVPQRYGFLLIPFIVSLHYLNAFFYTINCIYLFP